MAALQASEQRTTDQDKIKFPPEYIDYRIMKELGIGYWELLSLPEETYRKFVSYIYTEGKFFSMKTSHNTPKLNDLSTIKKGR